MSLYLAGGAVVFAGGGHQRSGRTQLAGIAMAAAGLLTKAGARADIADGQGKTARDLADNEEILAVLAASDQ